jgi:hypothetical protein
LALFHELTLLDLINAPWLLAGEIKLAPLVDKTSHLSLMVDSLLSSVMSLRGDDLEAGQGDADSFRPANRLLPGAGVGAGRGSVIALLGDRVAASGYQHHSTC